MENPESQTTASCNETSSSSDERRRWPIRLVDHQTMYAKILYDVEGNILTNRQGRLLNVFRSIMDDAFENKEVRLYRNSTTTNLCYRYFVTSIEQRDRFLWDRQLGSKEGPNKAYHVYVDEDVDRSDKEYKYLFRLSREIDS